MSVLINNFVSAQLSAPLLAAETEVTVYAGQGAQFPEPIAPDYAVLVLEDVLGVKEIVHLTARTVDVLTIVREREGTLASDYAIDSRLEMRLTAGYLQEFVDGGEF